MLDGPRWYVAKVDVSLDGTGDFPAPQVVVDPSTLSSYQRPGSGPPPARVRIDLLDWDIQDGLAVSVFWEGQGGGGNSPIWRLVGRSMEKAFHVGGLQNNADQPTGRIVLTTKSTTTGPLFGSFKIHCVKQP